MSPQYSDIVPESGSHAVSQSKFDVIGLLAENKCGNYKTSKDLPDVHFEDNDFDKSKKGGCSDGFVESNDNGKNDQFKKGWLNDGSIDPEDTKVLKQLFDKANASGGVKGEAIMLDKINNQLAKDGSPYRIDIVKSSGNTRTFQLSKLSDSKCGPREIPVDTERVHLGGEKPIDKKALLKKLDKNPESKESTKKLDKEFLEKQADIKKLQEKPESKEAGKKVDKMLSTKELENLIEEKIKMFKHLNKSS